MLKLEALCQACSGTMKDTYWNSRSPRNKYIDADNLSISQNYSSSYDFTIQLSFGESLKLINLLKKHDFIREEITH